MKLDQNKKLKFIIDISYIAIIIGAIFLILKYLLPVLVPFVIGYGIAMIINKGATRLSKRMRLPQGLLAIILLILTLILAALFMVFIGNQIYEQILSIASQYLKTGSFTDSMGQLLDKLSTYIPDDMQDSLKNLITEQSSKIASGITSILGTLVLKTPSFLLTLLISIIASFIIAGDYRRISLFLWNQFPERVKKFLPEVRNIMFNSVYKLVKAYLIIMLITFSELALGLTILGEKYALAIAAITALIDILPVLGSGSILIPWAVLSLINGQYPLAIGLGVLYAIILVVRQIIEPRVVGHSIGLHPLVTLMALYVGFKLFSVVGMFGLPVLLIILKSFQDTDKIRIWKD